MVAGWTIVYTGVGKVTAAFTEKIIELVDDESDVMLHHLYMRIDKPRYQMRVKW